MDHPSPGSTLMTPARQALEGPYAGLELAYLDWGPKDARRVVVCVHGLTRNAHDFDVLAEALAGRGARVLAVDVVGRGHSSWLDDPAGYTVPAYAGQLGQFLALLHLPDVDWVGTSMGGFIGMLLAAAETSPIRRLVLNDIGPFVPQHTLQEIRAYLGLDLLVASPHAVEHHLRLIHATFGPLTDAEWRHLAIHSMRETSEGFRLSYDPAIRVPFAEASAQDIDLWPVWDKIRCPTFLLHGSESVLLAPATVARMECEGPKAAVATFAGIGHAPALMSADQIATIERWLDLAG
jgi:pimeloyl-ACP methyl ester carboxylesterase